MPTQTVMNHNGDTRLTRINSAHGPKQRLGCLLFRRRHGCRHCANGPKA
jgi:hypothetical protein